jgi:predicted Zn-dependent protease
MLCHPQFCRDTRNRSPGENRRFAGLLLNSISLSSVVGLLLLLISVEGVVGAELRLPSFLPDYFRPAFKSSSRSLALADQRHTNGVTQCIYSIGANEALSIESFKSDAPGCRAAFNNILAHLDQVITTNRGTFIEITETELHAEVTLTNVSQTVFVFVLPNAVNIWTHSVVPKARRQLLLEFRNIRAMANRQRYEEALREGNVSLGQWHDAMHDYANDLLMAGNKSEALSVFQNLLATSPYDFESHLQFIENTSDLIAATNSARAVFKNAENSYQISRAAGLLGIKPPNIEAIPSLSTNDTGLAVILIPLQPCNPWLLEESAKLLERITEVPVSIRSLGKWTWGLPDRIARQRELEAILVRLAKKNLSFAGWTRDRYLSALTNALESEDALSRYWGQALVTKVNAEPCQYRVDSYMEALRRLVEPHRTKDTRTMYVGITEANIYGGDNNFVFSVGTMEPESHVGLMSYYMMLGKATLQSFDSRPRLIERMAKELVPASLKQLRIPRSTDPSCPYSYSSGIERLDQKTLNLSDQVKRALDGFRNKGAATTNK